MTTQEAKDVEEIRALFERFRRSVEARDPDAIVAEYDPKVHVYDAIPPFRLKGREALKQSWAHCFPYMPEKYNFESRHIDISVSGDLAFAHGLHHFSVEGEEDHPCAASWLRFTSCLRRIDGRWRIVHDHCSMPFDPMTSQIVNITNPDE